MSTIRVGSSEKYASGWDKAFGGGKKSDSKATAKKAAPKKAAPESTKKKAKAKKK
jgi:hypothetical protein